MQRFGAEDCHVVSKALRNERKASIDITSEQLKHNKRTVVSTMYKPKFHYSIGFHIRLSALRLASRPYPVLTHRLISRSEVCPEAA